jgi:hypothetical protein
MEKLRFQVVSLIRAKPTTFHSKKWLSLQSHLWWSEPQASAPKALRSPLSCQFHHGTAQIVETKLPVLMSAFKSQQQREAAGVAYEHPSVGRDCRQLKSVHSKGSVLEKGQKGTAHASTEMQPVTNAQEADTVVVDGALHKRMDEILNETALSAEAIRYVSRDDRRIGTDALHMQSAMPCAHQISIS